MKKENLLLDLLGLASLVGMTWGGYQLFKLVRDEKKGSQEAKSSISGLKTMTFTLTNNTDQNQVENLFDSRSGGDNPNVGIQPSINFFNNELSNKPKKLMKVEFRTINTSGFSNLEGIEPIIDVPLSDSDITIGGGGTVTPVVVAPIGITPPIVDPLIVSPTTPSRNQAEAPFKMTCADADGNSSSTQYTPLISANQYQGGITSVDFNGKILDGECYMQYTMFPKSKVAIVLYYEDMALSDLLDKKKDKSEVNTDSDMALKKDNKVAGEKQPLMALGSLAVIGAVGFLGYRYLSK
ncbi:MAG: hypothetical protein ACW98D_16725 [Promethearchaeota archaeon]|jgi:hypothetical protein